MAQIKIITENDVLDNVDATSKKPVQSKILSTVLSGKLDTKGYASSLENKVATIVKKGTTESPTYEIDFQALPTAANADWNQTDTSKVDFIKNKPFKAVGAGLTVKTISDVPTLTADVQFQFKIFTDLPTASADYKNIIALKLQSPAGETGNLYDEYACINVKTEETPEWTWELLGSIKASVSQTTTAITINGVDINTASATQIGLLSSTDYDTFSKKQAQIPAGTAGQVVTYSGTAGTVNALPVDTTATTGSTNLITSNAVYTAVGAKQDKIAAGTSGNVVTYSGTEGTVGSLAVDTTATTSSTNLITSGAVYTATSDKVPYASGSDNKTFKIGHDSDGYYFETA